MNYGGKNFYDIASALHAEDTTAKFTAVKFLVAFVPAGQHDYKAMATYVTVAKHWAGRHDTQPNDVQHSATLPNAI